MTELQTLAHEVGSGVPESFDPFWAELREEIGSLPSSWRGTIDGEVNQVLIPSVRSVRVAGRLTMPAERPSGLVVTIHGWEAPDDFLPLAEAWSEGGAATLRLRVRGYPPSTMDIEDLRGRWIVHKLGLADSWIVRGAVADVVQACRCARRHFGPSLPVGLHGDSLGGGLAVIAAAQLTQLGDPPSRLAIAHPDLGDWRWRIGRYCSGAGASVNAALIAARQDDRGLRRSLLLFDAALHARRVQCPVLCKLAGRDDVVPAPAAAAVFNALPGGRKRRFLTGYGHFDGGLAEARRHEKFERVSRFFLNFSRSPEEAFEGDAGGFEL